MMKYPTLFVILVCWWNVVDSETAPYIKPCHSTDTPCLISSAQDAVSVITAGIPSMDIKSMEPLLIDQMKAEQAGLSMDFRNNSIYGFNRTTVLDLKRHKHSTSLKIRLSLVLLGDYTLRGRLLLLPIEGDGKYKIMLRDFVVNIVVHFGVREVDGAQYWNILNWKYTTESPSLVRFLFKNLFNEDKRLSQQVLKFANDNWEEVFREVAPPIVKAIVDRIVQEVSKLFYHVPIAKLDLD